jgi:hypothetical protein
MGTKLRCMLNKCMVFKYDGKVAKQEFNTGTKRPNKVW